MKITGSHLEHLLTHGGDDFHNGNRYASSIRRRDAVY